MSKLGDAHQPIDHAPLLGLWVTIYDFFITSAMAANLGYG